MQGFRFSLFYLCIFINNPVISIPSAVTLRSWSIRAKFPLLFPYIFFLLIFYPPFSHKICFTFSVSRSSQKIRFMLFRLIPLPEMSMPFLQPLNQPFSAYRSFPEYPVTFYDINHFFMYAAYFIRVYSGEKVADCINFWNPSTDTVFQSFRHAFRGFYFLKRNLCSRCLHLDSSVTFG